MEGWDFMNWFCEPDPDDKDSKNWSGERTELKHGFGSRYSWSNCIYDNLMEKIKSECDCSKLADCNDDTKWTCASKILQEPIEYTKKPQHKCTFSCKSINYEDVINSGSMSKEPQLCQNWLTKTLKSKCDESSSFESSSYSGLCSQVQSAESGCKADTPDTSYTNKAVLQKFAKEKLVSMNLYLDSPWMKTNYFHFIMNLSTFLEGIMITLMIYFGYSMMSLPELIYYTFCSRGGGCICKPVMESC